MGYAASISAGPTRPIGAVQENAKSPLSAARDVHDLFPCAASMMTITRTSTASVMAGSMRATLSGYWRCCGSSFGNRQTKTGISIADAQTILCDFVELDLHDCAERGKLGGS
jgi:hypothetical protein